MKDGKEGKEIFEIEVFVQQVNVYVKKQACHSNQQGGSCFCFLSDAIQTKYMSMCVVTMHFATFLIVSVDTKLW